MPISIQLLVTTILMPLAGEWWQPIPIMNRVTLQQVVEATAGQTIGPVDAETLVSRVSTDSRTIAKGDVFWALRGTHYDGHHFVDDAFRNGAAACVVDASAATAAVTPRIAVQDTLKALWDFTGWYRQQSDALIVGVTGSVGKTTTREMVHSTLSAKYLGTQSPRNFNNHIGVPLSLLEIACTHEFAVIEMGASHVGEIRELARIAAPEIGVVTAISEAHLEGFGHLENIVLAKSELVESLPASGFAVLNGDDANVRRIAECASCPVILCGVDSHNDVRAVRIDASSNRLRFEVDGTLYDVQATGRHHLTAALAAVAVAREVGMSEHEIIAGLRNFRGVPGRCYTRRIGPWTIIDDTYNANPESMRAACELLASWEAGATKLLVVGDMLELGPAAAERHFQLGFQAAESGIDGLMIHGRHTADVVRGALAAGMDAHRLADCQHLDTLWAVLNCWLEPGAVVLVKGSRSMHMERVVAWLETQAHYNLKENSSRVPTRACA